jgi:segregation and condensation protein B
VSDSAEARATDTDNASATDLSRAYGALFHQEGWESEADRGTEAGAAQAGDTTPATPPSLLRILEALLFVGGSPLTAERAAAAIRGLTPEQFTQALDALNRAYRRQGRPYTIQSRDNGHVLTLRAGFRPLAERLYGQAREARLSPAAIDVLSLVAYRQPVAKQEIDSIRGAESGSLLRQLVRRGLICVVQRGESSRREVSYGTSQRFLDLFKLRSLDDLPQTQDLQKL